MRERVARAERRVLDERRVRGEGALEREHGGQLLVVHPDERAAAASARSLVSATTSATGSPWYFVSPVARTGRSSCCGPNRGTGCGRSSAVSTRWTPGMASAAAASTPRIRARATSSGDELRVERVRDAEVREVRLGAGDATDAADAVGGRPDARRRAPSLVQPFLDGAGAGVGGHALGHAAPCPTASPAAAASTASKICS